MSLGLVVGPLTVTSYHRTKSRS